VRDWAADRGIDVSLSILCRERRREKGAAYIEEIERTLSDHGLGEIVRIEPKVSLDELRQRIAEASALIVPSLYDPFCLMPTYAVEVRTPAFVSCHAGVSENIKSRGFIFDPQLSGGLARAVASWYEERPTFQYESCFPSYLDLYLAKEAPQPWA
jgi:glycosyltransferase involved in cell wall biosynthesis